MSTLDNLAALDLELREARLTMKKRIEEAFEKELAALEIRRDILAYQAREEGVPVTQIARVGLHTKATITAYRAIAHGEEYVKPVEQSAEEQDARLVRDGKSITFTPTADEIAPVLEKLGLDAPADACAVFTVTDGAITAVTPSMLPSGTLHPVVAMVMADGSKYARELVQFAEGDR